MESNRIASWWLAWEDMNWPSHDNLDKIKARADKLAQANVTAAMIFGTHFRWDWLPFFTMLHDYLGTVAEELHKRGLKLYDHHSVNLIHRYHDREGMRRVMLHSGPHLPLCPSSEAAEHWQYNGKKLNDWRMIDVKTRQVLWFPQYAAEGFCQRNPEFVDAYKHYVKQLIADTGIDGLSADDPIHYMKYNSCACPHCRAELKRRSGIELPPVEDQSFWGNWDNPAWKHWLNLRFEATGEFMQELSGVLPEGFALMSCGGSSATPGAISSASDARQFLRGCTLVNLEMSGNTPPYKHDPVTANYPVSSRLINSSHHQAAAREAGTRCFGTGFGFTEATANIVWAVNKTLGSDCWFSTLKGRLGLPDRILNSLPEEGDLVGQAFGFEAKHPELFGGEQVGQLAVYFSYETRNHTFFGATTTGYYKDYRTTLETLFRSGVNAHTVFEFPKDAQTYPLVLLPSALAMTEEEMVAMKSYLVAGGKVVVTGPSALPECRNSWKFPSHPDVAPTEFFQTIRDGVWIQEPKWDKMEQPACPDEDRWSEPMSGLFYNPCRMEEDAVARAVLDYCRSFAKPMPLQVEGADGYLVTMFRNETGLTVHLLAEDYDTDIDHKLDEIRFHRSRVNYITKVEPVGVSRTVRLRTDKIPVVYTPFNQEGAQVEQDETGAFTIHLPECCSYALLRVQ